MEKLENTMKMLEGAIDRLYSLIDWTQIDNVDFADVHEWDAPDYCDAYIVSADLYGEPLTERELDIVNEDRDLVYEQLMKYLH